MLVQVYYVLYLLHDCKFGLVFSNDTVVFASKHTKSTVFFFMYPWLRANAHIGFPAGPSIGCIFFGNCSWYIGYFSLDKCTWYV